MYDFCKDVLIHVWCCVPDGSNFYRFSVWNFQQNSKPCPFLLLLFQELKKQSFEQHVTQSREVKQLYISVIFFFFIIQFLPDL